MGFFIWHILTMILSLFLVKIAKIKDSELKSVCFILSAVPLLNIISIGISTMEIADKWKKIYKEEKIELNNLNRFKECGSCEMIIRNGYIKDDVCPICKKKTYFNSYNQSYLPSNKIEEQKKIKNLKQFKKDILLEKTDEQELRHLKILEERLKNKKL